MYPQVQQYKNFFKKAISKKPNLSEYTTAYRLMLQPTINLIMFDNLMIIKSTSPNVMLMIHWQESSLLEYCGIPIACMCTCTARVCKVAKSW
jgi:hypothetical protein